MYKVAIVTGMMTQQYGLSLTKVDLATATAVFPICRWQKSTLLFVGHHFQEGAGDRPTWRYVDYIKPLSLMEGKAICSQDNRQLF